MIIVHVGNYKFYDDHGTMDQRLADYDLMKAGYLVFSIEYRLAPDGLIVGQHVHDSTPLGVASGRPPQQWNDVKQEILAAYNDAQCNKEIFILAGSAGATHAFWDALDPTASVPGWPLPAGSIKALVGLSGIYDLSLRVPPPPPNFIADVVNYTNSTDLAYQLSISPLALVSSATNIPPVMLYATDGDSVPPAQSQNMRDALVNRGVSATYYNITGSTRHAFQYWHMINTTTQRCVSSEVVQFFNDHK